MANVLVISETPQRVIIRDEAATRTVKVVAQGPQGPVGSVNPQMFTLRDQAQASADSADIDASAAQSSSASAFASATAAAGSATAASSSATSASGSATTATTKAGEASTSATNAAASAATASTKASEASTSATNAANSAAAAATSATNTANALVGERSAVATLTNKTITGGTVNPTTLQEGGVDAVIQSDIGTGPNQIPLNQYLGPLAYRDENPAGAVVGTTATQTLANKTITSPVIDSGVANGVAYLNSSKVLTSVSALTFDGVRLTAQTAASDPIVITSTSADSHISIKGSTSTTPVWAGFGATFGAAWVGSISNAPLAFYQNNTEKMRLTGTGLGIGTTSTSARVESRSDANSVQRLLVLRNNHATAGSAGSRLGFGVYRDVDANNLGAAIDCLSVPGSVNGQFAHGGHLVLFTSSDGSSGLLERARFTSDGYLRMASGSGGIQFNGDTAAANALDDYEEGTFTPRIIGATTAGEGTYVKAVGRYTKVGNVVHFDLYLLWTAHTGTGYMLVADMPFVNSSLDSNYPVFSIFGATIALTANNTLACFMIPNSNQIQIQRLPVGGGDNLTVPLDTNAELLISGSYRV